MKKDKERIEKFLEKPKPLSELEDGNWAQLLTILHILMVKYEIKKTHLIFSDPIRSKKNHQRLAKAFEIPMYIKSVFYSKTVCPSELISNEILLKSVESSAGNPDIIVYSRDEYLANLSRLTSVSFGKLSDYPDCCILWFVKNQTWDYEIAYNHIKTRMKIPNENKEEFLVWFLQRLHNEQSHLPILEKNLKIITSQLKIGRKKFPFCFHQPCDECMKNDKSPTYILNKKYAKFAKENFPELFDVIIHEANLSSKNFQKQENDKKELSAKMRLEYGKYEIVLSNFDSIVLNEPPPINS